MVKLNVLATDGIVVLSLGDAYHRAGSESQVLSV